LEAEFNDVELLPKTKKAAIMATATYIAANASNDDEHMRHLRNLALEGVRVLQARINKDMTQHHIETSVQQNNLDTRQRRQQ
jgi:hypothetical protein